MNHYILELVLWTLAIFLIGCVIGYLLRRLLGAEPVSAPKIEVQVTSEPVLAAGDVPVAEPMPPAEAAVQPLRMDRPRGIEAPRDSGPDDLQRISGIGPKNEKILHTLGFYHFDQIAGWSFDQIAWVDDHLKFNGRIGREEWVEQARLLAEGLEEQFERRFGSGRTKQV
jgi:NADH-quinone oxidoreductase subunit E